MIHRYNASYPEGCFIFNFIGFKKNPKDICEDCGGECCEIDETKSMVGCFGDIETVRHLSDILRNIEDFKDEEGIVNF
jgi:hypothetical protein